MCKEGSARTLVVVGTGPTALGLAYRLHDLAVGVCDVEIIILEQENKAGGLAMSHKDEKGFTWDNGGHVVFSHYKYFDKVLDEAVSHWNKRKRAAYAFMMGSSGKRKFIPYPVQDNIHVMDKKEQAVSLKGLQDIVDYPITTKPANFDQWLVKNFGEGLCNVFMRKYNQKVWTVKTSEMNSVWVGERVSVPDIKKIKAKIAAGEDKIVKDSEWGPNKFFRFPRYGGTGGIWIAVSKLLPQQWYHYRHEVTAINLEEKYVEVIKNSDKKTKFALEYDLLVSTMPLDTLVAINVNVDGQSNKMKELVAKLIYSHTHVIGIGLRGQAPEHLADKSWIYFPDADAPFYRVTVFSNYSDDHVPKAGKYWSLMCEVAEQKEDSNPKYWTRDSLLANTVQALILYGFLTEKQIVSRFYHRLAHGYPVPSLAREDVLAEVQPWLQAHNVFSRGRFGGWRYEVGNQDHSFMQGVELADYLMRGIPEETYPHPEVVNAMKASDRFLSRSYFS